MRWAGGVEAGNSVAERVVQMRWAGGVEAGSSVAEIGKCR